MADTAVNDAIGSGSLVVKEKGKEKKNVSFAGGTVEAELYGQIKA